VYKFGTSIGYPKEHLDKKYSEIVAFAETEKNMGMYGKNVSTEKILRLKFAIATFREAAKIIVLDDLLSTKDMHFVRKGMKRIKELADSGVSVLIITASMEIAESYCDKVYNI
jgi:ABC-type polysaccharide/polyol phosphate transport system ATPase subunit